MSDEIKDVRVTILMTPTELKEVDDWSFERRIRSRGAAMRSLLRTGLTLEPIVDELLELAEADSNAHHDLVKRLKDIAIKRRAQGL